ncbi:hypothetical protein LWM68_26480 [Niabella sp. W65]|nr:hypothetical protein [Niabella sp. W65]MCH7366004.1 hypothetical protein [Niabella sp. W65]ULT41734.1 hypothetical protein KRR40_45375 [Niabella sp. I65]
MNAGSIKAAENKLDRVSRIAAGGPTSAGRKQNVVNAGNNLTTQQAKANLVSAAVSSTSQKTSDAVSNILNSLTLKASQLPDFEKLRISVSDNTRVNSTR